MPCVDDCPQEDTTEFDVSKIIGGPQPPVNRPRYPSKMHLIGSTPIPSPPSTAERVQSRKRSRKLKKTWPRRGLDFNNLPEIITSPKVKNTIYPRPRLPFPPATAHPMRRKISADMKIAATKQLLDEGTQFRSDDYPVEKPISAVLLQQSCEFETTKRLNLLWDEAKEFKRMQRVWRRYKQKHHRDVTKAIEYVENEIRLLDVRKEKERIRFVDEECNDRSDLLKRQAIEYCGLQNNWSKVLLYHINYAKTVVQQQKRRHSKAAVNFYRNEGASRQQYHDTERIERVALLRTYNRAISTIRQSEVRRAYDQKRGEQLARSVQLKRKLPSSSQLCEMTPSPPKPRTHLSITEYRKSCDEEQYKINIQHLVNKEDRNRRKLDVQETMARHIITFLISRDEHSIEIVTTTKYAKARARKILASRASFVALERHEIDCRQIVVQECSEQSAGLHRLQSRTLFRLWLVETSMRTRHSIHQRKLKQLRTRATFEQNKNLISLSNESAVQSLAVSEHRQRCTITKEEKSGIVKITAAEQQQAIEVIISMESSKRRAIDNREISDRLIVRQKSRQRQAFADLCVITKDSITEKSSRNIRNLLTSQLHHNNRLEKVEREGIFRIEATLRNKILKEMSTENSDAWSRHRAAEQRRSRARQMKKLQREQKKQRAATQKLIFETRRKQTLDKERKTFENHERDERRSTQKEEGVKFSSLRLKYLNTEVQEQEQDECSSEISALDSSKPPKTPASEADESSNTDSIPNTTRMLIKILKQEGIEADFNGLLLLSSIDPSQPSESNDRNSVTSSSDNSCYSEQLNNNNNSKRSEVSNENDDTNLIKANLKLEYEDYEISSPDKEVSNNNNTTDLLIGELTSEASHPKGTNNSGGDDVGGDGDGGDCGGGDDGNCSQTSASESQKSEEIFSDDQSDYSTGSQKAEEHQQSPSDEDIVKGGEHQQSPSDEDIVKGGEHQQSPSDEDIVKGEEHQQSPSDEDIVKGEEHQQSPSDEDIVKGGEHQQSPSDEDIVKGGEHQQSPSDEDVNSADYSEDYSI